MKNWESFIKKDSLRISWALFACLLCAYVVRFPIAFVDCYSTCYKFSWSLYKWFKWRAGNSTFFWVVANEIPTKTNCFIVPHQCTMLTLCSFCRHLSKTLLCFLLRFTRQVFYLHLLLETNYYIWVCILQAGIMMVVFCLICSHISSISSDWENNAFDVENEPISLQFTESLSTFHFVSSCCENFHLVDTFWNILPCEFCCFVAILPL